MSVAAPHLWSTLAARGLHQPLLAWNTRIADRAVSSQVALWVRVSTINHVCDKRENSLVLLHPLRFKEKFMVYKNVHSFSLILSFLNFLLISFFSFLSSLPPWISFYISSPAPRLPLVSLPAGHFLRFCCIQLWFLESCKVANFDEVLRDDLVSF